MIETEKLLETEYDLEALRDVILCYIYFECIIIKVEVN